MKSINTNRVIVPAYLVSILLFSIIVFFDTWESMVSIWIRSETFTHGFIVIPISLWLIWSKKEIHAYLQPSSASFLGLSFLIFNGFIWFLSSITQTLVIQQYTLIGMLIGSIWFYLGNATTKKIIFPLAFLYLMVPVGEALLPYLMGYTANFTIALLRLTGITVYREGMHFSLVSGQWSVVEACSGLRYLLASITLGTIYAYITYNKLYKRAIFIFLSIVIPIIANGFRAYMIVMIGHLSNMELAVGIDHLIYGAVFFAIIIFMMFYVGSFWRDPSPEANGSSHTKTQSTTYNLKQNSMIGIVLLLSLSSWPFLNNLLQSRYHPQTNIPEWPVLTQNPQWQEVKTPNWSWKPKFDGVVTESLRYFKNQDSIFGIYQANFGDEQQGTELVNTQNVLIRLKQRKKWHYIEQSDFKFEAIDSPVDYAVIRNNRLAEDIVTIKWYQIGPYITNNIYLAKIYQLLKHLTLNTNPEIYNVIFTKSPNKNQIDQGNMPKWINSILSKKQ